VTLVFLAGALLTACEDPVSHSGGTLANLDGPGGVAARYSWWGECPVSSWVDCEDADVAWMISEAIAGYWGNPYGLDECDHAKNAILARIQTPFHLFASHTADEGSWLVLGEAGRTTGLLGFRKSIFNGWGGEGLVFQVAIHEGAHLAGLGEGDATNLEDLCRDPY
jgi:hypothetical protein